MRLAGILIVLFFAGRLSAQQLTVKVLDQTTNLPVAYASVLCKTSIASTTLTGSFTISYPAVNDTISVSHVGYKTYKFTVGTGLIPSVIYLQLANILLNEVLIKGKRNYKKDSLTNRREFSKAFRYQPKSIKDVFIRRSPYDNTGRPNNTSELVSINLLQMFGLFGTDKKSALQKTLLRDEQDNYVSHVFSKEKIENITALKGDSLQEFMVRFRPSAHEVKTMTEYNMIIYIKKCYADYRAGKKSEIETIFKLSN